MACRDCVWWVTAKPWPEHTFGRCQWEDFSVLPTSWTVDVTPYPPLMQATDGTDCPAFKPSEGE